MGQIGIFPISFSGCRPIESPQPFRQSSVVKMTRPVALDPVYHLMLLRRLDRCRKWQSLDDRRFCRCCHKFISGHELVKDVITLDKPLRLACPTPGCHSTVEDWVHPDEIAQPPDRWGRRVIRVVDRNGERFVVCGKSPVYSRRRFSQPFKFVSKTAA